MIEKKRGVAFLWLILVSMISSSSAGSVRPSLLGCELEMSTRARALTRLIEVSMQQGDLILEDLETFIEAPNWTNPFSDKPKSPKILEFRRTFEKTSKNANPEEMSSVKQELKKLALRLATEAAAVDQAKRQTARVISPKVIRRLKVPRLLPETMPFSVGWLNGQPVFVGRLESDVEENKIVVFEPFRAERNTMGTIVEMLGDGTPLTGFDFFERNGTVYAVDLAQPFIVDLNKKVEVARTQFASPHRGKETYFKFSVLVQTPTSVKQIGLLPQENGQHQFVEFDILNPQVKPRVLAKNVITTLRAPRVDFANGKAFVTYYSFDKLYVYNASEGRMVRQFKTFSSVEDESSALVYEDEGKTILAFLKSNENYDYSKLRLLDLDTNKATILGETFLNPGPIDHVTLNGVPYLYLYDEGILFLINLRTKELKKFHLGEQCSHTRRFQVDGVEHLIWRTGDNSQLNIFNLKTLSIVFSGEILRQGSIYDLVPVTYRGQVYALATVSFGMPYLIRLTTSGNGDPP